MAITKERGKIILKGEIAQGTSKNGNVWQRQQAVFEVAYGNTFRRVAAQAGTDMVVELGNMQVGDIVDFGYVTSAREWQGKWYAQVDLLNIEKVGGNAAAPAQASVPQVSAADLMATDEDDLPFGKEN